MIWRFLALLCLILPFQQASVAQRSAATLSGTAPDKTLLAQAPATCPATKPSTQPFVPPPPFSGRSNTKAFWYGTDALWTSLPTNGVWLFGRKNPPAELRLLRTLEFWRQPGWDARSMARLVVTASRLDAEIPPVTGGSAYDGGWLEETPMIQVPIKFPTSGCWQVTGHYEDREVIFTVWVPE
jgi:hypothetical protein